MYGARTIEHGVTQNQATKIVQEISQNKIMEGKCNLCFL